ncbi:uncharacterized protein Tco025E_01486 [Trypanosoma conorhini]|uniref:Uncharacterized protein n=1 Tax=Trypanosoma conorhini TaxID=83891 RepID=A0A422Q8Q6_9TRYP|nr:uncharacterized protein Tco025E_01486 [Trypanosoma conorhini]RNF26319.1 hypothetical protein Tco025E_01486 [Trypanosoma conorhini]
MGCASSTRKALADSGLRRGLIAGGKERAPVDAASDTSPQASKGKTIDTYDALAVAAAHRNTTPFADYRGVEVYMAGATPAKMNAVCRWLDSILEVRERNGGCFIDQKSEASSVGRGDNLIDVDDASVTVVPEGDRSLPNRLNVSMHASGASCNARRVEKLQSKLRPSEFPQASPRRTTNLCNEEKMPAVERFTTPDNSLTISILSPLERSKPTLDVGVS